MNLRTWHLHHVLFLGAAWVLLLVLIFVIRSWSFARQHPTLFSVSFGIAETALLLFGPPLLLLLAWLLVRRY